MTRKPVDFATIKEQMRFEAVLAQYGIEVRGQGAERMIRCPFHDDSTPSCAVNLDRRLFHCFACGEKGTVLDFVAAMERCSIAEAARLLARQREGPAVPDLPETAGKRPRTPRAVNQPLGFSLSLDPDHPYLADRGVSPATVEKFGLGYCDRGVMKGRICVPIHDADGRLVAYAGRWAAPSPPPGEPRYRFPRGFRKNLVLFNWHHVRDSTHLVVVEGCWSVFRLDALGIAAVALMGRTMSDEQEEMIRRSATDRVTLLLDGDEPGRTAITEITPRLARHSFVHAPELHNGAEPDVMDAETLVAIIRH